jgi:hypothetical protein
MPKIRRSNLHIGFSEEEIQQTRYEWYRKAIRKPDILEREFLSNNQAV